MTPNNTAFSFLNTYPIYCFLFSRAPKPTLPTFGPNQVTPGFSGSSSNFGQKSQFEVRGQGSFGQGGGGSFSQGGQGQFTVGGQGKGPQGWFL